MMEQKRKLLISAMGNAHSYGVQICHTDPYKNLGGTEKYILEEVHFIETELSFACVQIFPSKAGSNHASQAGSNVIAATYGLRVGSLLLSENTGPEIAELLGELGQKFKRSFLHIHHLLGWGILDFQMLFSGTPGQRDARRAFFLHDFHGLCPSVNFVYNGLQYCGGMPLGSLICNTCSFGSTRETQVNFFMEIAEKCDYLVAPSLAVWTLYSAHLPHLRNKITVSPLLKFLPAAVKSRGETAPDISAARSGLASAPPAATPRRGVRKIRVGFVGPETLHKGWDYWQTLSSLKKLKKRIQFVQLGGKPIHVPVAVEHVEFGFSRENPHAALAAFQKATLDVLLILSRVPETYSFTFYESLASTTPVLCFAVSGNVAYEVSKASAPLGKVFSTFEELLLFLEGDEFNLELLGSWKQNIVPFEIAYNPPSFMKALVPG